ncbi:hypothetical protein CI105_03860 [Candidatus Izimaplasma bacterium ZiA1]|uniref:ABC transporter permease n=1 Tax=Candidatus Izimoplasma sp. ZiA1 TaxID=2024899 RepID=UPI000BAA484E|nr:hypothetical protein CI105_03860 [Candidatus Izimaplasma bacterium ZiA1]
MKLLYKDQFKKIKYNKLFFFSLVFIISLVSMTYTITKTSVTQLKRNYQDYVETQNVEDFYFGMKNFDIKFLNSNQQLNLCIDLNILLECSFVNFEDPVEVNEINTVISELLYENQDLYEEMMDHVVNNFNQQFNYDIEKSYIVNIETSDRLFKFLSMNEVINIPYLVDGSLPVNENEIAIFEAYALNNNLSLDDTITINNTIYTIKGYIYAPDFILPMLTFSSVTLDQSKQTIVYTTKETVKNLNQDPFIKYSVKGNISEIFDNFGYEDILSSDLSYLGKNLQLISIIVPRELNYRIVSVLEETQNAEIFADIFLTMFILFISLVILIFLKKHVEDNKIDTTTLHKLGYSKKELCKMLMVFPLLISLFVFIGYLAGIIASNEFFDIYSARYFYPKSEFKFSFNIFFITTIIPIIFINFSSYVFIRQSLKTHIKKPPVLRIKLFKYTPLKTIITSFIILLIVSTMTIFSINANNMFTDFVNYTKIGNNYENMVIFNIMKNDPLNSESEPFTKVNTIIIEINDYKKDIRTSLYGINPTSRYKVLIDNDYSKNLLLNDGAIISEYLSSLYDINIGDKITYKIGDLQYVDYVVGISNELIESNIYTSITKVNQSFNLDSTYYNGTYTQVTNYQDDDIRSVLNYNQSISQLKNLLQISSVIINYILYLSAILSIFVLFIIIYLYLIENEINIAILKSVGYNNFEIFKKYVLVILVIFILTYIIAIPLSLFMIDLLIEIIMRQIGYKLVLNINIYKTLFNYFVLQSVFILCIAIINRYFNKVSISSIIKKNVT